MLNKGIFKQINQTKRRFLCGQVEHTTGELYQLVSKPICDGKKMQSKYFGTEKKDYVLSKALKVKSGIVMINPA